MNDKSNPTLEEMASEISEMEKQLLEMKKAYRERKYEGLKIAMDAKKSAEEAVNEELKSLGLRSFPFNRSTSIWWQVFKSTKYKVARRLGFRSGLEVKIAEELKELSIPFIYEGMKIEWEDLAYRMYTPDFVLPNGIIIETKGRFTVADRRKHLLIKKQHPKLDIRFVFENENNKLRKGSKTSYGKWCEKNGFLYCTRVIPEKWLKKRGTNKHPELIQFRNKKI